MISYSSTKMHAGVNSLCYSDFQNVKSLDVYNQFLLREQPSIAIWNFLLKIYAKYITGIL